MSTKYETDVFSQLVASSEESQCEVAGHETDQFHGGGAEWKASLRCKVCGDGHLLMCDPVHAKLKEILRNMPSIVLPCSCGAGQSIGEVWIGSRPWG